MQLELFPEEEVDKNEGQQEVKFCTVSFTVGWLPGSVGLTDQAKAAIAAVRGVDPKSIRGSYAILGASRDPLIKEGASLRRILFTIRDEYTIPEYTLRQTSGAEEKPERVAGSYLIEAAKVEEFLERFEEARTQYLVWGERVASPEHYNRIREADRMALAHDWDIVEEKYPSRQKIADAVGCDIPKIEPFQATFTLANVAPQAAARLKEQAERRLEASLGGAVDTLISEFRELVEAVAKNCGRRVRLHPVKESPYRGRLNFAEVLDVTTPAESDDVPEGMLAVRVLPSRQKGDKLVPAGKPEVIVVSEHEYNSELRPLQTEEYRQLTTSGFENVKWLANKIRTIQGILTESDDADGLLEAAQEAEKLITRYGSSPQRVAESLRGSSYLRRSAHESFQELKEKLVTCEIKHRKLRAKSRRKIIKPKEKGGED